MIRNVSITAFWSAVLRRMQRWDWGDCLALASGIYLCAYVLWVIIDSSTFQYGQHIEALALVPLSGSAVVLSWRTATTPGLGLQTRRAWRMLAFAFLSTLTGDILWYYYKIIHSTEPFPSLADASYLLFYPLMLWGLLLLPLPIRSWKEHVTFWLDATIVLLGVGMGLWHFLLHPIAVAAQGNPFNAAILVLYPVGDIFLLFGITVILLRYPPASSRVALSWLGVGLLIFFVTDLAYAYLILQGYYTDGSWLDVVWGVAFMCTILSAQSQYRQVVRTRVETENLSCGVRSFSVLPYLALVLGNGLLLWVSYAVGPTPLWGVIVSAVVLDLLLVARLLITVRENIRLQADLATRRSEARFRSLAQNASDVILLVTADSTIEYHTPSVTRVFGYDASALLGTSFLDLLHPEDLTKVRAFLSHTAMQAGVTSSVEWRLRHRDGHWHIIETIGNNLMTDPTIRGIVLTIRDITERKRLQDQVVHQAFHDSLTDLPNRALLHERLQHALARASRHNATIAVLFLDLNNFKMVNDSLGHHVGDQLLVRVAQRLHDCVRPEDTLARLGGDEFTILIESVEDANVAVMVAERILLALQAPFLIETHEVVTSVSIGIAFSSAQREHAESLLQAADIAMYKAKMQGEPHYAIFDEHMLVQITKRLGLEAELRQALAQSELVLAYQPVQHLTTGTTIGLEALVRWRHPTRGLVLPAVFIPLAEETGLIVPLGRYVLQEACRQMRAWQQQHSRMLSLRVSVNLSARQFQSPHLVDEITDALALTGLAPQHLVLELTESMLMAPVGNTLPTLQALKRLGVQLALDDFGTGYSSLAYLARFPIDILKIDRSFIERIDHDPGARAIVHAIISLAHTLKLTVIGEGIETPAQLAQLRMLECTYGQGEYLAPPLTSELLEAAIP